MRLAEKNPELPVGRLHSSDADPYDKALDGLPNVRKSAKAADLAGLPVVISTAAKWAHVKDVEPWRHAIVDEAYQMRSDALLAVAGLFERALFVGDPGQLDPFSIVGAEQWAGLSYDPSASAVPTLLAHNPQLPQHRLPVSWRLPASAAPLVSRRVLPVHRRSAAARTTATGGCPSACPSDGSGAGPGDRRGGASPAGACWSCPPGTPRAPTRRRCAAVADGRPPAAGPRAASALGAGARDPVPLTADRIAVGTAHRDQAAAVRAALAELGVADVTVDTANRLQGREFDVTVVLHPLSGRPDATAFHLETGRLCVLASRHRHACVVVCRAGVADLLDAHPSTEPVQLGVTVKFPDGWEANHAVLAHLADHRVPWTPVTGAREHPAPSPH